MTDIQEANQVMIRLASCEIALKLRSIMEFLGHVLRQASTNNKWGAPQAAIISLQSNADYVMEFLHDFLAIEFPETDDPVLVRLRSDVQRLSDEFQPLYQTTFKANYV